MHLLPCLLFLLLSLIDHAFDNSAHRQSLSSSLICIFLNVILGKAKAVGTKRIPVLSYVLITFYWITSLYFVYVHYIVVSELLDHSF
jgi:hypothetical protein